MQAYAKAIRASDTVRRIGKVVRLSGLAIEAVGPDCAVGDVCELLSKRSGLRLKAEVVALQQGRVVLMPYGELAGIGLDCDVVVSGTTSSLRVGAGLLGRVIDAFGQPLDGRPLPPLAEARALKGEPLNPLGRPPIQQVLETGVRCIDALLTVGRGQRMGIFAGSGVGKSTLLGMVARNMRADVNVIGLIGERGREVREFIDKSLGPAGLARSVVVVATSDQPAAVRTRAAYAATTIAEHFRDAGLDVMLTMDSVTRFAMARREIGLSVGEPPTARGYTPSVFAELPRLLERCGTSDSGGSITALYTVLVEGDDLNDPIADALRSILDGHLVMSRQLANHGHYPAIDVLHSVSRLLNDLASPQEQQLARAAVALLSAYEKNHQMIEIGAYRAGSNPQLDRAMRLVPELNCWLQQETGKPVARAEALQALTALLGPEKRK
ncbi:MAG TPA: FliI/YscN family ATPase [Burkholderiaceae bacterium]|nr:FliI/YscN family ATPase [Burkholderiaceae bacterium]